MLRLPEVTLACVDTRHPALALQAMARCTRQIAFAEVLLFTEPQRLAAPPPGLRVVPLALGSSADYSRFMLKGLGEHLRHGSHVLVVQWDGFVLDAGAWDAAFLQTDYIGPRWHDAPAERSVGNGGFSLRSRRLLQVLADASMPAEHPEDVCIGRTLRDRLEAEHGLRFAPPAMAERFGFERLAPQGPTFGFHGLMNFDRAWPAEDLVRYLQDLPDELARSLDAHDLCKRLITQRRLDAAGVLLDKRRRLGMRDRRTWRLRWRHFLARRLQSGGPT